MPIGKRTNKNKELGDAGEALTRKYFNLQATSGSGAGAYDKLDCKNDWVRVETKTTATESYSLNLQKFHGWRLQAAQDRKAFFMHIIPKVDGKLVWEDSFVVCTASMYLSLKDDSTQYAKEVKGNYKLVFKDLLASRNWSTYNYVWCLIPEDGARLVVVRAPYFKQLLDKDNEDA